MKRASVSLTQDHAQAYRRTLGDFPLPISAGECIGGELALVERKIVRFALNYLRDVYFVLEFGTGIRVSSKMLQEL